MAEDWAAAVETEEDDDGLFVPILVITPPEGDVTRVVLTGVYRTEQEALVAGREAVKSMAAD